MWQELSRMGNSFALDIEEKFYVNNSGYILNIADDSHEKLAALCHLLNSRVTLYSLNQITTRFDETGWRWLNQFVMELVIPTLTQDIVAQLATAHSVDVESCIFKIYNFTQSEINFIKEQTQIAKCFLESRED